MPSVLVIDDDLALLEVVQMTLSGEGYCISTARNGAEGLKVYDATRPDLVITDLVMPDMEGIETIVELRRRDPRVRIIAMSGSRSAGPAGFLRIARGAGARHTLAKPFSTGELLTVVHDALHRDRNGEVAG